MAKINFTNKIDSIANPIPAINKVVASDLNSIKESVNEIYDSTGWMSYSDNVHTVDNKQLLASGIDSNITIVDPTPLESYKPISLSDGDLWSDNKITPMSIGDFYLLRFDFSAEINNANGHFDFKINIGGSIGNIVSQTNIFPKGSNTAHHFSISISTYTLDTFIANGGTININPSNTMLIWDKKILIQRVFSGELHT